MLSSAIRHQNQIDEEPEFLITLPKRYLKKTSQTGIIRTFADVFCPPK